MWTISGIVIYYLVGVIACMVLTKGDVQKGIDFVLEDLLIELVLVAWLWPVFVIMEAPGRIRPRLKTVLVEGEKEAEPWNRE